MHVEEMLITALSPIVPAVAPQIYRGDALEYITFDYYVSGSTFAEGIPVADIYSLMVHHYLPTGKSPYIARGAIVEALMASGCTYPSITDATDDEGQHWVFECYWKAGVHG